MRTTRITDSQILAILKQSENDGFVPELFREHGMSTAQFELSRLCCHLLPVHIDASSVWRQINARNTSATSIFQNAYFSTFSQIILSFSIRRLALKGSIDTDVLNG